MFEKKNTWIREPNENANCQKKTHIQRQPTYEQHLRTDSSKSKICNSKQQQCRTNDLIPSVNSLHPRLPNGPKQRWLTATPTEPSPKTNNKRNDDNKHYSPAHLSRKCKARNGHTHTHSQL